MTKEQLLEHFRRNMDNMFERNPVFTPYNSMGVNDGPLWYSSNPLTAILYIDLTLLDKGSVIVADVKPTNYTVNTIYTPKTMEHPLNGNRQWGVFNLADNPGSTYFYTQAVDRIRSWMTELINQVTGIGWESADELWKGMQWKMTAFVNENGGSATIPGSIVPTPKPKWDELKDVISGKISVSQFKSNIGCP